MKLLTLEQIIAIHSLLIEDTGGSNGIRDIGRLESAIATQTQAVFGKDIYDSLHEKAAAMIRGIIADHPFVDGNKRTGMLTGLTFLEVNGIEAKFVEKEIEDFAVKVAVEHLTVKQIANWLEKHSK